MFSSFFWILFCILFLSISHSIWNVLKQNKTQELLPIQIFTNQEKIDMEQQLHEFIQKESFLAE